MGRKAKYTREVTELVGKYARALGVLGQKEVSGRWKTDAMLDRLREHGYTVVIEGVDMVVCSPEGDIIPDPDTAFEVDAFIAEPPVNLGDYRDEQKALKAAHAIELGTAAERLEAVERLWEEIASKLPPSSARYKLQADLVKLAASMPERGDSDDGGTEVVPVEVDTPEKAAPFIADAVDAVQ